MIFTFSQLRWLFQIPDASPAETHNNSGSGKCFIFSLMGSQSGVYLKAHFKISGYKRLHAYDNPAVMMSAGGDHSYYSCIGIDRSFHQCLLIIQILENSSTIYFFGIPAFRSVPTPTQLRCQFQLILCPENRKSE